ncbi:MAG TPA: type II secretion system F family protein [Longilinea sp.]|nr:type II secretion system F family protein [Longilinea sp.]
MNMDPMIILYVGGGLAVLLLVVGVVVSITSERSLVEERIGRYVEGEKTTKGPAATPLTDWLNKRVERSSFGEKISKSLARADLRLKPGEYIALMLIAAVGVGIVAWFIFGQSIPFGLIGAVGGMYLPNMYVQNQQKKRLQKFNEQLSDMLNLMVNGLRAGYSTMQAMEAVAKELPPPICDEFRRVVQEMSLGVPMEKALDNLLRRIPSDDLDLCITAMNVQREVGGNLAEILDTISFTIRERVRIKGEIRVLTTQVMYSGKFLAILPLIVMGILYLLNPAYMNEFFNPANNTPFPCGYFALGLSAVLIALGYFVMTKLSNIEI